LRWILCFYGERKGKIKTIKLIFGDEMMMKVMLFVSGPCGTNNND